MKVYNLEKFVKEHIVMPYMNNEKARKLLYKKEGLTKLVHILENNKKLKDIVFAHLYKLTKEYGKISFSQYYDKNNIFIQYVSDELKTYKE